MKLSTGEEVIEPDMGLRVRALRLSTGKSAAEFQRWLVEQGVNVTYSTWKNYEAGYPMYWRIARQICGLFPLIDMNYFYLNTQKTMDMARQLRGEPVVRARLDAATPAQSVPA
jgi:hypothetical protein